MKFKRFFYRNYFLFDRNAFFGIKRDLYEDENEVYDVINDKKFKKFISIRMRFRKFLEEGQQTTYFIKKTKFRFSISTGYDEYGYEKFYVVPERENLMNNNSLILCVSIN